MLNTKGAILIAGVLLATSAFANFGDFAVSTDYFNYNGTVTRYATLADAQNQTNAVSSASFATRDGSVYQGKNNSYLGTGYENSNILLTAWWYTTDPDHGEYSGWGNPNNTNDSFVQLYNDSGSFTTSSSGYWSDSFTKLNVSIAGANADAAAFARLWPGVNNGGQGGVFLNYNIDYAVSGLTGVLDTNTNWMVDTTHRGSLSGSFKGVFQNTSTSVPANNGYYVFDLALFDSGSTWAEQQSGLNGALSSTIYAAPVPEPASMSVLGLGALAMLRRRRAKVAHSPK